MTVIRGKVYPDHEFPQYTFGYHADRNSVHDYGTPLRSRETTMRDIEDLKKDPKTYRLRVARYQLVGVTEIECIGERPANVEQTLNDLTPEEIVALVRIVRIAEHHPPAIFQGPDGKMTTLEHLPGVKTLGEKIGKSGERDDVKQYLEEHYP